MRTPGQKGLDFMSVRILNLLNVVDSWKGFWLGALFGCRKLGCNPKCSIYERTEEEQAMTNQVAPDKKIEPRRLKGFRDYMPNVMEARSRFQEQLRATARLAGFREIGTPALEYQETLLGQGSDETDKQVYRFEDHGGRDVGLRFDLTVPFARFVAEHQGELLFPFKRLQIGDVWRGENTQKGRYREFCQCDLDIIGVDSVNADIEVLSSLFRILSSFNIGKFTMQIGNRVLLSSMIRRAFRGIDEAGEIQAFIALDKLDKIGAEGVVNLLTKIPQASIEDARMLLEVLSFEDHEGGSVKSSVLKFLAGDDRALAEMERMVVLMNVLNEISKREGKIGKVRLNLSIARGLGYYTGVVFETILDEIPGFGSISSGGRYNNLAERFTSRNLPGVGGSIGLDRLLAAVEEMGRLPKNVDQMVFIAIATSDALPTASYLARDLRSAGIACDIGLTVGKVGNQFKHADRQGCPFVLTLGSDEIASQTFGIKNMKTSEERRGLALKDAITLVKGVLSSN